MTKTQKLAEKMGWKLIDWKAVGCVDGPPIYDTGDPENPIKQGWNPESNDTDAMELMGKLLEDGFQLVFAAGPGYFCINSLNEPTLRAVIVAFAMKVWGIED
jgi:hypothetical protein